MAEDDRPTEPADELFAGRRIELTDPRAMRAYAHPVRLALSGLLRRHGPRTATQAALRRGDHALDVRSQRGRAGVAAGGRLRRPVAAAHRGPAAPAARPQALVRPCAPRITGEAQAPDGARQVTLIGFAFADRDDRP
jgi:hypothetical protein